MKIAALQMISGPDPKDNLVVVETLLSESNEKFDLIVLPEMFACFGVKNQRQLAETVFKARGEYRTALSELAKRHESYLVAGTLPIAEGCNQADKVRAASIVFDPQGNEVCRYDKIHLFDVEVGDSQGRYAESDTFEAGDQTVVQQINTANGNACLGLSVCYDLRFPQLYQKLVEKGAEIILVPSAFTYKTGKAHWMSLLKARAIETQSYVVAPGQGGQHDEKRRTWGHSVIIDPWGRVLSELDEGEGVATAEIDLDLVASIRKAMPLAQHRKEFK